MSFREVCVHESTGATFGFSPRKPPCVCHVLFSQRAPRPVASHTQPPSGAHYHFLSPVKIPGGEGGAKGQPVFYALFMQATNKTSTRTKQAGCSHGIPSSCLTSNSALRAKLRKSKVQMSPKQLAQAEKIAKHLRNYRRTSKTFNQTSQQPPPIVQRWKINSRP